jgi:hypothetical protein
MTRCGRPSPKVHKRSRSTDRAAAIVVIEGVRPLSPKLPSLVDLLRRSPLVGAKLGIQRNKSLVRAPARALQRHPDLRLQAVSLSSYALLVLRCLRGSRHGDDNPTRD